MSFWFTYGQNTFVLHQWLPMVMSIHQSPSGLVWNLGKVPFQILAMRLLSIMSRLSASVPCWTAWVAHLTLYGPPLDLLCILADSLITSGHQEPKEPRDLFQVHPPYVSVAPKRTGNDLACLVPKSDGLIVTFIFTIIYASLPLIVRAINFLSSYCFLCMGSRMVDSWRPEVFTYAIFISFHHMRSLPRWLNNTHLCAVAWVAHLVY